MGMNNVEDYAMDSGFRGALGTSYSTYSGKLVSSSE